MQKLWKQVSPDEITNVSFILHFQNLTNILLIQNYADSHTVPPVDITNTTNLTETTVVSELTDDLEINMDQETNNVNDDMAAEGKIKK